MKPLLAPLGAAAFLLAVTGVGAQEHGAPAPQHDAAPADKVEPETRSTPAVHGIIRSAQPKRTDPVKVAPGASTEAVAAAIAAAMRSVEDANKTATPVPAQRRSVRSGNRVVPPRRYTVPWPSQRIIVRWESPEERVDLTWCETGSEDHQP